VGRPICAVVLDRLETRSAAPLGWIGLGFRSAPISEWVDPMTTVTETDLTLARLNLAADDTLAVEETTKK
jgi:hypothetical protein